MHKMYLLLIITIMVMGLGCGKTKEGTRHKTVEMTQAQFMEKLKKGESFALRNDIELEGWESVHEYKGKLEGKGKKVIIKSFKGEGRGLINEIGEGGEIKDINLELKADFTIAAHRDIDPNIYKPNKDDPAGVLAAVNKGMIEGVKVEGKVKVKRVITAWYTKTGGLIGTNEKTGHVKNSSSWVGVEGGWHVGGLVGMNKGVIEGSAARGGVKGESYVGGLVGGNWEGGRIEGSHATGSVGGEGLVGGLVGMNSNRCTIKASYATGAVKSTRWDIGGLVGMNSGRIEGSHATGSVEGEAYEVGGLVGDNWDAGTIKRSYATGDVRGKEDVGGLVGVNWDGGTIKRSYATGDVRGAYYVGGLVGRNWDRGTIKKSFTKKGIKAVGAIDRGSTTNITLIFQNEIREDTFTAKGWSSSIWSFKAGEWPTLAWQK